MPQYQSEPPYQPRLRPHRLVPADTPLPEDVSAEPLLETWALALGVALPPEIAEGGRALAQRAWLVIEKAALTLDAMPPILKAAEAPEEALETLKVIASVLLALPDQLAGGMDTNIARADQMFARLLNAPGRPGLIEQVMFTLAHAGANSAGEQEPADYTAELETLRGLHRNLVALQLEWDDLLAPLFPEETLAELAEAPAGSNDEEIGATQPLPSMPAPLPDGLVVAVPASEGSRLPRFTRGRHLPRLALLIALLLFASGTGLLLLRHPHTPTINPGGAALAVGQQTQVATATSQPTEAAPTATPNPRPTSRPLAPTPTPQPPSSTPSPTPGASCLPGATFCASALWLQVPCASRGTITFQLTNTTNLRQSWQAVSSDGPGGNPLVSIIPSSGHLKAHQTMSLTVQASASGNHLIGMLTISGSPGTLPLIIALAVCG